MILMDCVRADRLSLYGHTRPTSPSLEALAHEATVYDACIAASCWTIPSQASLFTGLWPSQHGVNDLGARLPGGCATLAETLRDAGYATYGIVNSPLAGGTYGFDRGFESFHEGWRRPSRIPGLARLVLQAAGMLDAGAGATRRLIREAVDAGRRPFFIFAHFMEAHSPYFPPARFWHGFVRSGAEVLRSRVTYLRYRGRRFDMPLERPDADLQVLRDLYEAAIRCLDAEVAECVDFLDRRGILDETVVVVTADHGENIGDHGLMEHNFCLYDSLLHVPLIVRFPYGFERGRRVDALVQLPDLFPTLRRLAGAAQPPDAQRTSPAADLPRGPSDGRRDYAYAEYYAATGQIDRLERRHRSFDFGPTRRDLWAVRSRERKLIADSHGQLELFDLARDPAETLNLAQERVQEAEGLQAALTQWRSKLGPSLTDGPHAEHEQMVRRLRELGYL
jgi:arylsulfatase A-like enzyme